MPNLIAACFEITFISLGNLLFSEGNGTTNRSWGEWRCVWGGVMGSGGRVEVCGGRVMGRGGKDSVVRMCCM